MKISTNLYCIITTMDGVPVMKDEQNIMQFMSTQAMRDAAKHLTFTKKERYHTWGLSKNEWFKAKKYFEKHGYIPLGILR